jgi:hypothetical protein
MRPLYESEADLARERDVAALIEQRWKCQMFKLPLQYHLDYAAVRNDRVVAFCEIKVRTYTMDQIENLGGYMISLGKWTTAHSLFLSTRLPFALIVKAQDGVYHANINSEELFTRHSVVIKGRKDRNDWQDIEPCVLLNTNGFKRL